MMSSTVRAQTSGFEVSVARTWLTRCSPFSGGEAGCSHEYSGGTIHDTSGSCPFRTSSAKVSG